MLERVLGEGAAYQGAVADDAHAARQSLGSQSLDTFSACHHISLRRTNDGACHASSSFLRRLIGDAR